MTGRAVVGRAVVGRAVVGRGDGRGDETFGRMADTVAVAVAVAVMEASSPGGVTVAAGWESEAVGRAPAGMLDSERPFGEHVCDERSFDSRVEHPFTCQEHVQAPPSPVRGPPHLDPHRVPARKKALR
jgi:hypothetical protein